MQQRAVIMGCWEGAPWFWVDCLCKDRLSAPWQAPASSVCVSVVTEGDRGCLHGENVLFIIFLPPVLSDVMTVNQSAETHGRERDENEEENTGRHWNKFKKYIIYLSFFFSTLG